MCLSGGGKQAINHCGCNGSWVRAMAMADPSAPLAKGNKQGTGCWLCCWRTQSVCNAACPARGLGSHAVYLYQTGGRVGFLFFFSTAGNSWDSYIPGEMADELGAKKHRRSGITQSICAAHSLQASGAACMVGQWVTVRTPGLASASGTGSQRARMGWRQSCKLHAPAMKHSPLSFCWATLRGAWHHRPDPHPLDIGKY